MPQPGLTTRGRAGIVSLDSSGNGAPDSDTEQKVGDHSPLEQSVEIQCASFGNQGMNGLVVRWYCRYASPRLWMECSSVAGMPVTL